jgi:hypothetical protein
MNWEGDHCCLYRCQSVPVDLSDDFVRYCETPLIIHETSTGASTRLLAPFKKPQTTPSRWNDGRDEDYAKVVHLLEVQG